MPDDGSECCFDGAYCPNGYSCSKGSFCCSKSNPNDCTKMTMAMGSVPTVRDTQLAQTPSVPIQYHPTNSLQPAYTLNPNYQNNLITSANADKVLLSTGVVVTISVLSVFLFCVVLLWCLYFIYLNNEKDLRIKKFEEWVKDGNSHKSEDRENLTGNEQGWSSRDNPLFERPKSASVVGLAPIREMNSEFNRNFTQTPPYSSQSSLSKHRIRTKTNQQEQI